MFDLKDLNNQTNIDNLVVGGAGFLGSNLVDFLIDKGDNVICVDNLSSGNIHNINHLKNHSKFKFLDRSKSHFYNICQFLLFSEKGYFYETKKDGQKSMKLYKTHHYDTIVNSVKF